MHRPRLALAIAGLLTLASHGAHALQHPDSLSAVQRAGLALARLSAGQPVRFHSSRIGRVRGSVVSSSAGLLIVETSFERLEVPAPEVDSLWVRCGGHAGTGALIGVAVGGLALGVVGALATHDLCDPPGNCDEAGGFVAGFVIGGAGGAGLGALLDAAAPKWRLRVP